MTRKDIARIFREKAYDMYYVEKIRDMYLIAAQALEEEPRKQERWILIDADKGLYACSGCGNRILLTRTKFCANCGSIMLQED